MSRSVDVIIPTLNRLWSLKIVVPHYLGMDEVNRVIIVTDGSNDGSCEWLLELKQKDQRLKLISNVNTMGACAARNAGASLAEAPYVFFADDDMLLRPGNALTLFREGLLEHNGDIIGPLLIVSQGERIPLLKEGRVMSTQPFNPMTMEIQPSAILSIRLGNGVFETPLVLGLMMMRREVLERIRYDEELGRSSYRDETIFQLQAAQNGFKVLACPQVVLEDLKRRNDTGGCHQIGQWDYTLSAIRNNWKLLKRFSEFLPAMGFPFPILVMQGSFIFHHVVRKFPIRIARSLLKRNR